MLNLAKSNKLVTEYDKVKYILGLMEIQKHVISSCKKITQNKIIQININNKTKCTVLDSRHNSKSKNSMCKFQVMSNNICINLKCKTNK